MNDPVNDPLADDDSIDAQIKALAEAAVFDAVGRSYPRPSVARIAELAEHEDGPGIIYAIFMAWIDAWMNVLSIDRPNLGPDDFWHYANEHILVPDLGGNSDAGMAVRRLLLYKLGLAEYPEGPRSDRDPEDDQVIFFYENIFRAGPEFRDECALLLLFMVKAAFIDAHRTGRITGGVLKDGR